MDQYIGMWVDHSKACLVILKDGAESLKVIESEVEPRVRAGGGNRANAVYGSQEVSTQRKNQERRKHQLHQYYRKIIDAIREARKVYIFGPGVAKNELLKEIDLCRDLEARVVAVEAADKMTPNQMAARVRKRFPPEIS